MIDTASPVVQMLFMALSFGALVVLARAQWAKARRMQKQPLPIRVERDPRERNDKYVND
jgi:hypothetical protein